MQHSIVNECRRLMRKLYDLVLKREIIYLDKDNYKKNCNTDILYLRQLSEPVAGPHCRKVKTMKLDMHVNLETLWSNLSKTSKYEINRALRDGVLYTTVPEPSPADIQQFLFASYDLKIRKGVDTAGPEFFQTMRLKKQLYITKSYHNSGDVLSWHVYIKNNKKVFLFASVTMLYERKTTRERRFAGRANRYHHWRDICLFKDEGIEFCDLGGWAYGVDENDPSFAPLYYFNKSLGANLSDAYHVIIPVTPLGHLVVKALSLRP